MKISDRKKSINNPWNPAGIAVISAFFTILPAGVIHALNYDRLGLPERKKSSLLFTLMLSLAIVLLAIKTDLPNFIFLFFNLYLCIHYQNSQSSFFKAHIMNGGQKASLFKPVIYSVLSVIILTIIAFALVFLNASLEDKKFNYAVELIDSFNYSEAEKILVEIKKNSPEATDIYHALSLIYLRTGRKGKAVSELRTLLKIDPNSKDAVQMLMDIQNSE